MKIVTRIKLANEERARRYQRLLERIERTNNTGYPDEVVLAIRKAERGLWSKAMTVEEHFADLGL